MHFNAIYHDLYICSYKMLYNSLTSSKSNEFSAVHYANYM